MKRVSVIILLLMTMLGVGGCMQAEKMTDIIVTIGKENIKCITLHTGNGMFHDSKTTFNFAFEQNAIDDIKYIKTGEKVTLDFGNNPPDKITIKDSLLNSSGEYLYTDKETIQVPFTKENNKYYFTVESHPASALSSTYKETDFRGYRIIAYRGENEYIYAFVIKTDSFLFQKEKNAGI